MTPKPPPAILERVRAAMSDARAWQITRDSQWASPDRQDTPGGISQLDAEEIRELLERSFVARALSVSRSAARHLIAHIVEEDRAARDAQYIPSHTT